MPEKSGATTLSQTIHRPIDMVARLGISSIIPTKELLSEILLKQADSALYMAKNESRNSVKIYADKEMHAPSEKSF